MAKGPRRKSPVHKKRSIRASPKPAKTPSNKAEAPRGRALPIEVDPSRIDATLFKLKEQLVAWANKGRYTKVRFKFRGKQLLPDLPLAAVLAVEGLTFYWGGILRALIVNVAGKTVLDVELVNASEKQVQLGKEALLGGDIDRAIELFREARSMDGRNPRVHLNLGIALKLKGDAAGARASLQRAHALEPQGSFGAEA